MGSDIQRGLLWILLGLSGAMLIDKWQVYNGRPSFFGIEPPAQVQTVEKTENAVPTPPTPTPSVAVPAPATAPVTSMHKENLIEVETDLARLTFDPDGAVIVRSELLKEKQQIPWVDTGLAGLVLGNKVPPPKDEILFQDRPPRVYLAQTGLIGGDFPNHKTPMKLVPGPLKLEDGQNSLSVKFEGESGGVKLVKTYTFERNHYSIKVQHDIYNNSQADITPSVYYQLERDGEKPEGQSSMINSFTGAAVYSEEEKFQKITFSNIKDQNKDFEKVANNGWVGMIQHYFVSAWVPTEGVQRENYTRPLGENLYAVGTIVPAGIVPAGGSTSAQATLYSGPQDQERLEQVAPGLSLVVDYGWLTFIAKPIYWILTMLHSLVRNWGWSIILLTCIVKAILYPLSLAGYKSMARMKDLGPRMKALKEKFGDDKQAMNQAVMQLYKTEKINPVGGCLPILLQLPVFLALYWVLLASVELRDAPWMLWITDLAAPDPWFILPAIMIFTMWIQYKLNPTPPDPMQAKLMMFMPFIFGIMFIFFPSGLVLYWLTNNILSIIQQYVVNKQIEKDRLRRQRN
ncbi:MAG: membrane protein insertase YidC [Burkholderiales bacterium]|nr:membrane protein insertase YidC [Burkholderiales bacterium]